jgi:hypothetical protein
MSSKSWFILFFSIQHKKIISCFYFYITSILKRCIFFILLFGIQFSYFLPPLSKKERREKEPVSQLYIYMIKLFSEALKERNIPVVFVMVF